MICRIAVLASGNGSNFEALVKAAKYYEVAVLICDHKDAYVIERARRLGITYEFVSKRIEGDNFEQKICEILKRFQVELVILAGFMKLVTKTLLKQYPQRIINIHPSLLPAYPGMHAISQAFDHQENKTGISIHYVDEGVDTGELIAQYELEINPSWDLQELEANVHHLENNKFPEVVNKIAKEQKWKTH